MMKKPLISIIIPVYNAEKTIRRIVKSVLRQSFREFELILVNDGSADGSLEILKSLAKVDKRVFVINQKNSGPSVARNAGLKKANGQFVMLFDADDEIEAEMLSEMHQAVQDTDLAVCGWQEIDCQKIKNLSYPSELLDSQLNAAILRSLGSDGKFYGVWNKIYRLDIIRKNNILFRPNLKFGEDLLFNLDYYKHISKICVLNKTLYKYYISESGVFSKSSLDFAARQANEQALFSFAEPKNRDLAIWVQTKWFIQFLLNLLRSNLPKAEVKVIFKNALKREKILSFKSHTNLSKKQLFIIRTVLKLQKTPQLFYLILNTVAKIRK